MNTLQQEALSTRTSCNLQLLGACGMSLLRRRIAGKLQVGTFNFVPGYKKGERESERLGLTLWTVS